MVCLRDYYTYNNAFNKICNLPCQIGVLQIAPNILKPEQNASTKIVRILSSSGRQMKRSEIGPDCQIIKDLKIDKKNKNRIQVTLENGVTFSVGLRRSGSLERGKCLDKTEIGRLQKEDAVDCCYRDAVRYLGYRIRSCRELHRYLKGKAHSAESRDTVIGRLENYGYINDADYARLYVENRSRFSPRGAYILRHELRRKGIAEQIIDRSLADLDEDRLASRVLEKRLVHWKNLDRLVLKKKALSFLYGRGFTYETARRTLEIALAQKPFSENDTF